jgi:Inositol 1,3,4-trisphosphate 5/6-kinase ATP-grasp domain
MEVVKDAGMRFPLLVKPLWTDGREGSHRLALVHTESALRQLVQGLDPGGIRLPVMVQQFVAHGGFLFKVRCWHGWMADVFYLSNPRFEVPHLPFHSALPIPAGQPARGLTA